MTKLKDLKVKVPLLWLIVFGAFFAASWLVTIIVYDDVHSLRKVAKDILEEFFKAIFIGISVGALVEIYLQSKEQREKQEAVLGKANVKGLHQSRRECLDEFERIASDPHVTSISIVGISLREFLRPSKDSGMKVWLAIKDRLHREKLDPPRSGRLKVRLLVLDPSSDEGNFRLKLEEHENEAHKTDVDQALNTIRQAHHEIYDEKDQDFLQIRFYGHCPFSFMFITEEDIFVEQYYYQNKPSGESPAVVQYAKRSPKYGVLKQSFDLIWKNAKPEPITTGTAVPIDKAGIENIFREDQRDELSHRQVFCIEKVKEGAIDILAISARHYVDPNKAVHHALLKVCSKDRKPAPVKVRIAVVNPVSQQAILRAVADDQTETDIRNHLRQWDWRKHKMSDLYLDVTRTRYRINNWKKEHSVELRLYSSSVAYALLLTPTAMFMEQYIYGRTKQDEKILRGEYPVIEFNTCNGRTERDIVASSFQRVWEYFSISGEEYGEDSEEDEFQANLLSLQKELKCLPLPQ